LITSTLTAGLPVRPTPADELRAIALRAQLLGRHQMKPIDAEAEKRTGWHDAVVNHALADEPAAFWRAAIARVADQLLAVRGCAGASSESRP
jgi:hypothetical protein